MPFLLQFRGVRNILKVENLKGQKFGRLKVKKDLGMKRYEKSRVQVRVWLCECDCGNTKEVIGYNLIKGRTQSCGCLQRERTSAASLKHGQSVATGNTKEYRVWGGIKARCYNENHEHYANYGGRGIKMCPEWKDDFEQFYKDMGKCPEDKTSIDRIDNDGDYEPNNCRWATQMEQNHNTRMNVWLEHDGKRMVFNEWMRELRVSESFINDRLRKGISFSEVVRQAKEFREKVKEGDNGRTRWIEYDGKKMKLQDWVEELKIPRTTLIAWLNKDIPMEEIVQRARQRRVLKHWHEDLTMTYEGMEVLNGNIETNT